MDSQRQATVFASGLDNPRGLAFGSDGQLYVAEGGRGGTASTQGSHRQIPAPVGPYTGGATARVSRIGPDRRRVTVADGLPSSQSSPGSGALTSGVADVAFLDGMLYALVAGGGASHGLPDAPNGIYRIEGGAATLVADLGAYRASTSVAQPDPNDDEYDGTWFSMTVAGGAFYTVEPNHGDVVRVDLDGTVTRVVDLSARYGHIVPTAIAFRAEGDSLYVGNLGRFPAVSGSSRILRIGRDGAVAEHAAGLTTVLGLAFAPDGTLYALENSVTAEPGRPEPSSGRVVRVAGGGRIEPIVTGLTFPTGLTVGPDGALYVSTYGFAPAGTGRIERITL